MYATNRALKLHTCWILATLIGAVSPVWAVQVQFAPTKDNTLYEDIEGGVSNGSGDFIFMGETGPDGDNEWRRAVVAFDVSGIPAGAVIDSVQLSFEINQVPSTPAGGTATLHRLLADWGEAGSNPFGAEGQGAPAQAGDATWVYRFFDTDAWNSAGGDFSASASASQGYGTGLETLTFSGGDLALDVQLWVNQPQMNFGWVLRGHEGTGFTARRMFSRESPGGDGPVLTVDYSIPSPTDNLVLSDIATIPPTDPPTDRGPVGLTNAGDGSGRLFIVEQRGVIHIFDTATQTLLGTPFLDISDLVDDDGNEQGLLGLAFHPNFADPQDRRFYVYYTYDPGPGQDRTRVAMYRANAANPDIADALETVLLEFAQDEPNNNGGDIHFGRDGYLYIASGDGGGSDDEYGHAQDAGSLKGKILRIDVDGASRGAGELCGLVQNYAIPPGNAFPDRNDGCDEILHFGLRNPWRFSFDAQTGEMYIGDVGQFSWEEVDHAPVGASGINYGWSCREGSHFYVPPGNPCVKAWTDPLFEYGHVDGNCSVTGGFVYRGSGAALNGRYLYGDWCSGRVWLATESNGVWSSEEWAEAAAILDSLSSFGQGEDCELYVIDRFQRKVFRIDDSERIARSGFEALYCR